MDRTGAPPVIRLVNLAVRFADSAAAIENTAAEQNRVAASLSDFELPDVAVALIIRSALGGSAPSANIRAQQIPSASPSISFGRPRLSPPGRLPPSGVRTSRSASCTRSTRE